MIPYPNALIYMPYPKVNCLKTIPFTAVHTGDTPLPRDSQVAQARTPVNVQNNNFCILQMSKDLNLNIGYPRLSCVFLLSCFSVWFLCRFMALGFIGTGLLLKLVTIISFINLSFSV